MNVWFCFSLNGVNTRRKLYQKELSFLSKMANETVENLSLQVPGTIWFAVFIPEFIMIFIINAFTLIAFARNRQLRKRSTYLIINLTVADLLVGAVSGPLGAYGNSDMNPEHGFRWQQFIIFTLRIIFPVSSQTNLSLISLERLHATLYPFRHCLIAKWFYLTIIIVSWLIALVLSSAMAFVELKIPVAFIMYSWIPHTFLSLLVLTISYVIIIINFKSNRPPQRSGSLVSDRKLSVTLMIVTVVSISTILPWTIRCTIPDDIWNQLSPATSVRITSTVLVIYFANSLLNPVIYAIRMQEFRKAAKQLICNSKTQESRQAQPIELHAM